MAANGKRNIIEEVAEGIRQILEDLDTLISPEKQQQRARVPVPVRSNRDPRFDPRYDERR